MRETPAPYYEAIARAPSGGACHWLQTADGIRIRVGHWPLTGARGTVLIFPGRTEYIEKYGPVAQEFHAMGLAAMAIDWRGQGIADRVHTDPRAGHVEKFGDYQHDVEAYLAHARDLGMPEPLYLLGHSMGGCIGLGALYRSLPVAAACFTAPMWGIAMNALLRPTAWAVSWASEKVGLSNLYAPSTTATSYIVAAPFKGNTLTNDPEMFAYMKDQLVRHPELQLGGPSIRWLRESLVECEALAARPAPDVPCVTFLGTNERIVDMPAIHDRMASWPKGELVLLEGAEHEVLMETAAYRETIYTKLLAFFDNAQATSAPPTAREHR